MKKIIPYLILMTFLTACASLVKDEQITEIKFYEKQDYISIKDITAGTQTIPKGKKIKILIKMSSDWIKVYGYDYTVSLLDSERTLILYMFQDDFPQKKFSKEIFLKKLYESIKPVEKKK